MTHVRKVILVIGVLSMIILFPSYTFGQEENDTIPPANDPQEKKGSIFSGRPGKAFLFSMVVPGAGQIYNKSYLRVPFVWGAVGGVGVLLFSNTRTYECYRDAYKARIDNLPLNLHKRCDECVTDFETADPETIKLNRDLANKYRQWSIIGFAAVWLANGVDAFVDAHLKDFDIEEDISIDIGPQMTDDPYAPMKVGLFVKF